MARTRNSGGGEYLLIAAAFLGSLLVARSLWSKPNGHAPQLPATGGGQRLNMEGQRVLLIGSSSAVGVGPRLKTMLERHGISAFKNIGVVGSTLKAWSDNDYADGRALEAALAEFRPTVVFIIVGGNDEALRREKPNLDVGALRASSIARLRSKLANTRSIFLGLPQHHLWPMDRGFRNLLASTWGDDFFNTEAVAPEKASDGIHLSSKGYEKWVAAIDQWLTAKR
jgi:lysophospholipase L1-like esterase